MSDFLAQVRELLELSEDTAENQVLSSLEEQLAQLDTLKEIVESKNERIEALKDVLEQVGDELESRSLAIENAITADKKADGREPSL